MKSIDTLVQDIYDLVTPKSEGHAVNEEYLEQMADSLKQTIRDTFRGTGNSDSRGLRLSSIGKSCDRFHYYQYHGYSQEPMGGHTYLKFLVGHIVEAVLIFLVKEAGHTVTDEQKEVVVEGITGHEDCKIDGVLCDIKTASPYSFTKFKDGSLLQNDPFGYITQINGYRQADELDDYFFLAFDKTNGHLCTYEPKVNFDVSDRIKHLKEVLSKDEVPERGFDSVPEGKSGNMKLCTECSYCGHKFNCYPDLRLFLYSNKPVYLTHVEREPKVFEVTRDGE